MGIPPTHFNAKGDLIVGTADEVLARLAVGANDTVLTAASGETTGLKWSAAPFPAAAMLRAFKTGDQTVSTTTLTNDSDLSLTVVGSTTYRFQADLFISNGGATEGLLLDLTGSATMTSLKAQVFIYDDTLNTLVGFARTTGLTTAGIGAALSTGDNFAQIIGTMQVSAGGTFLLRFAQNAVGAGAGVTMQLNSWLQATRLT